MYVEDFEQEMRSDFYRDYYERLRHVRQLIKEREKSSKKEESEEDKPF